MFISQERTHVRARKLLQYLTASACLLSPFSIVHAAESCEASFNVSPGSSKGHVFEATNAETSLPARDAIAEMKKIAVAEGFKIGDESVRDDHGTLALVQPASASARAFPVDVTADQGRISMKAKLPAGMGGDMGSMKSYMCGLLSKVAAKAPHQVDVNPAASPSPSNVNGSIPVPFTPEQTTELCLANVSREYEVVDDSRVTVTTWTFFDDTDDARKAIDRVKGYLASTPGMSLVSERYHDKQGVVEFTASPVPPTNRPGDDNPMKVEVDEGMGAVGVSSVMPLQSAMLGDWPAYHLCKLAAIASRTPLPPKPDASVEKPKPAKFSNPFKRSGTASTNVIAKANIVNRGREAWYERAKYAGKAFLVVPALDVGAKYRGLDTGKLQTEHLAEFWADVSSRTIWRGRGDGSDVQTGAWSSQSKMGLGGFVHVLSAGKSRYALYAVDPGKYELVGGAIEKRGGALPKPEGVKSAKPAVGSLMVKNTLDRSYEIVKEWHDASYRTQSYDQQYCSRQLAASGQCVEWSSQRQHDRVQTSAAGYSDKVNTKMTPGLAESVELSKPFASFEVSRGDVAMIDGFFMDRNGDQADASSCKASEGGATCQLTGLTLWRIPARIDDVRKNLGTLKEGSTAWRIFSGAKIVPLTVNATAMPDALDGYEAGWARRYIMKAK
ncbi:hypothetical protein [Luteibacter sp. RCC_6_2]|uniref:hypothetical protein n=1 Tax=Luteibacter sp. RCC_6_2 TaxID=3239223 RepID=UPI0035237461